MEEVVPSLFEAKEAQAVFRTVNAAFATLPDPYALGVLALHAQAAQAALKEEYGSAEQVENENNFFQDIADLGVDIEGDLNDYCLKATIEERIKAGYEALRDL